MSKRNACKDCTQRRIGCHGKCDKYQADRLQWDTEMERRLQWQRGNKFPSECEPLMKKKYREMRRKARR